MATQSVSRKFLTMNDLEKNYNPKQTEDKIYEMWEKSGVFEPKIESSKKPFTIVIPPPNVTGSLHMGHAINNTIQDILIRRSRMKGVPTLWVPGTDHAGIATQNVVEKELVKLGKSRQDLGREKFAREVEKWVQKYGDIIVGQLKKLGCSCDWSRQRYTMDSDYVEAVKAAFLHYQEKGWIYQGERVINWCIRCQTALSDIEVEHRQVDGKLWYIRYQIQKSNLKNQNENVKLKNYITVATTRPETMLGDAAVAVNPDDKRYESIIGQTVIIPIVNRQIPIIADQSVDPKFGTGAVKVTPGHDANDFEIGERHKLASIKVIDETGKITQIKPQGFDFTGQKVLEAREKIIAELESQDLLEKIQDYTHQVPHCYRCGKKIEQLLSKQWFVKMKKLAEPAIRAVEKGEIKFVPERWEKVYLDWMKNLRDWCISRQIWFGHKIPIDGIDDVLDTWFSSALWPLAVLGWPKKTDDLAYFYPTTVLSTARDILYLWVARMIFSGLEFTGQKPFEIVYIHPTIFNIEGKRMAKSLGTGVDPLELIDKYGADATRFGLAYINTGVQDIRFDEKAIIAGRKFANKIWNIARFTILQMQNDIVKFKIELKTDDDKKITQSLNHLIASVNNDLDNFRFGQAAHSLYDFIWHDFADGYLEASKKEKNPEILLYVMVTTLKLLHPFMPYVSEEIWQKLYEQKLVAEKLLISAKWPEAG